ncbi:MAG: tail fiber domain-containing protein [Flavobacteriales bacterium]
MMKQFFRISPPGRQLRLLTALLTEARVVVAVSVRRVGHYLLLASVMLLSFTFSAFSQNMSINETGAQPDSSAMLDISSTNSGLLIPRMTGAQRNSITNPAQGLLLFQTDGNSGIWVYDTLGSGWEILSTNITPQGLDSVLSIGNDAGANSIVNIDSLGIGTSTPENLIHINVPGAVGHRIQMTNGNTGSASTDGFIIELGSNANAAIWQRENSDMRFGTNNTEQIRIKNTGFIGVGTSSPLRDFHVNKDSILFKTPNTFSGVNIELEGHRHNAGSPIASIDIINTDQSNSNTKYSAAKIESQNTGGADNGDLRFYTTAGLTQSLAMTIDKNGLVGIGTSPSQHTLEVAGRGDFDTLSISGEYVLPATDGSGGQLITTDGAGVLAWVDPNDVAPDLEAVLLVDSNANNHQITNVSELTVGQTSGSGILHITGDTLDDLVLRTTNNANSQGIAFQNSGNAYSWNIYRENAGSNNANLVFSGGNSNADITALSERMRISSSGYVGIGTNSPSSKLHISANDNTADITLEDTFPFILLNTTSGNNAGLIYRNAGLSKFESYYSASADQFYLNHLSSTGTDMVFTNSGNVGLNTTTPSDRMHMLYNGNIRYRSESTTNGFSGFVAENTLGEYFMGVQGAADPVPGEFHIYQNSGGGGQRLVIDATGNVGIAQSNPTVKLQVDGGSDVSLTGGGYFMTNDAGGLNIAMDENEIMARNNGAESILYLNSDGGDLSIHHGQGGETYVMVLDNGNVGIGTSAPGSRLTISTASTAITSGIQLNDAGANDWYMYQNASLDLVFRDDATDRLAITAGGNMTLTGSTIHTSDRRYKTQIIQLDSVLTKLENVTGVTHFWDTLNFPDKGFSTERVIGVIAQDLQKVYPELVFEDNDGYLMVDYTKFTAVLLQAIKEQQAQINALKTENQRLKTNQDSIKSLESRIEALENEIAR